MIVSEFQEVLDDYFQSTRELLESAERILMAMEREEGSPAPEQVQDLRRAFHTLKGNSAMMGFATVANVAHLMEDILAGVGRGDLVVEDGLVAQLLAGMSLVSEVVRSGEVPEESPGSWAAVLADLRRTAGTVEAGPGLAPSGEGQRTERPAPPSSEDLSRRYLGSRTSSLRVGQAKLDTLLELAGELHVLLTSVEERLQRMPAPDEELGHSLERFRKTFALLQDEVASVRMVPIGSVFSRFERLVRDLARAQQKEISFATHGAETTLDKAVVDELAEPLLHLLRNAVDHGIELPGEREEHGKPRLASVRLAARQVSDQVEIAVVDDGRGLDTQRIRERARTMGHRVEGLDERAVHDLVFLPGLSTRDGVTELSGRGVGLEVVKGSVERFGGSVAIQTIPGIGTEFRLRFPVTLAVTQALLVEVDGEVFAAPLNYLLEAARLEEGALHVLDRHPVVLWRGQLVPALDAGRLLETTRRAPGGRAYALVLEGRGRKRALLVDRLIGDQRIVVKRLDDALDRPFGISGGTLLGRGEIVMILDVPQILGAPMDELQPVGGEASR